MEGCYVYMDSVNAYSPSQDNSQFKHHGDGQGRAAVCTDSSRSFSLSSSYMSGEQNHPRSLLCIYPQDTFSDFWVLCLDFSTGLSLLICRHSVAHA